jgi:hypothetical protein
VNGAWTDEYTLPIQTPNFVQRLGGKNLSAGAP